jgi:hypothetical protein
VPAAKLPAYLGDELVHLAPGIPERPDPELRVQARLFMIGHAVRR